MNGTPFKRDSKYSHTYMNMHTCMHIRDIHTNKYLLIEERLLTKNIILLSVKCLHRYKRLRVCMY